MFVDSHAHLTSKDFNKDRHEVIMRAFDAGVRVIINPATDLDDSRRAIELSEKYDGVYACVGFHPHDAAKADDNSLAAIEELSFHPKVVAIGEIGLDYFYDFSPQEKQQEVFWVQVEMAKRRNLPVVIHTRDSIDDTIRIVHDATVNDRSWRKQENGLEGNFARGVFHCFSSGSRDADAVVGMGFSVSFPGLVTFKKADVAAEVVRSVSLVHLLVETDSPYLAPVPLRGKRNEPCNIPLIAAKIAGLKGIPVEEVAAVTTQNAIRLFDLEARQKSRKSSL